MRDLATEKGAKERQNLCGWLEISHLEIYPFLCTTSCLRVSTPNCYTWVLARRCRRLAPSPRLCLGALRWRARLMPVFPLQADRRAPAAALAPARRLTPQQPPSASLPPSCPRAGTFAGCPPHRAMPGCVVEVEHLQTGLLAAELPAGWPLARLRTPLRAQGN